MKIRMLIGVFLLFFGSVLYAQVQKSSQSSTGFSYNFCLKEVHFGGAENNYIQIKYDDSQGEYAPPHFIQSFSNSSGNTNTNNCSGTATATIEAKKPVAYVSGTKAKVRAYFQTDCTEKIFIRGIGPLLYEIPPPPPTEENPTPTSTPVIAEFPVQEIEPIDGVLTYDWTESENAFKKDRVMYFEDFIIEWQYSQDETTWTTIDNSFNPLYVTHDVPNVGTPASGGYDRFHTLFKVSCEAADGLDKDDSIIEEIWKKVKTKNVIAADNGFALTYYQDWQPCISNQTNYLLYYNDGQCRSWARFLIDLLKVHNLQHSTIDDDFYAIKPEPEQGFLIKNWSVSDGELTGKYNIGNHFSSYNYVMIPHQKPPPDVSWVENLFVKNNQYNFHYSDWIDGTSGIEGQGPNPNPESIFTNHVISNISGRLLDPAYGVEYVSLDEMENNAVFGYYTFVTRVIDEESIDLDGDGAADKIDLNGSGKLEKEAEVWVLILSTNKNVAFLKRYSDANTSTNH